jgi:hypothetical protein
VAEDEARYDIHLDDKFAHLTRFDVGAEAILMVEAAGGKLSVG